MEKTKEQLIHLINKMDEGNQLQLEVMDYSGLEAIFEKLSKLEAATIKNDEHEER